MRKLQLINALRRYVYAATALFLLSSQVVLPVKASATKPVDDTPKITICHRTDSYTNPYVQITVDQNAADGIAGNSGKQPDHFGEHQGPIFYPLIPKHTEWGDIIPPIEGVHNGLNWTSEGQSIWNNGCNFPTTGSIKVDKKVDTNGDGIYEGDNSTANNLGFMWGLDNETPARSMGSTANDVSAGNHSVTENSLVGYTFTGWYYTANEDQSCANPNDTSLPASVNVSTDQTQAITLCNQHKETETTGTITVHKVTEPANDPTGFQITASGSGSISDNPTQTLSTAQDVVYNVGVGTYNVSEAEKTGWSEKSNTCVDLVINADHQSVSCTITNVKKAKLTIVKEARPEGSQEFNFESNVPGLGNFTLVDDGTNTANSKQSDYLTPGDYWVSESEVANWTLKNIFCFDHIDLKDESQTLHITLHPGDNITCTFENRERSTIEGHKFNDLNGNGVWDEGEPTLEGWTINLFECKKVEVDNELSLSEFTGVNVPVTCSDVPKATTTTDEDGAYSFGGLPKGFFLVCEVQQAGWTQTDPSSNGGCYNLETAKPGQVLTADFGNFKDGTVSGFKWADTNGNTKVDSSEAKLSNWTITVYKSDGEDGWNKVASTQTDASGNYSFTGLKAGDYKVCETPQSGWTRTFPTGSDCQEFTINKSGQEVTANFGNDPVTHVLGASTIVNTGSAAINNILVGLLLLGSLGVVSRAAGRSRKYSE